MLPARRRPAWRRRLALRRGLAAVLLVAAVVLALRPAAPAALGRVVVARSDLAVGTTLGPGDLEVRAVPPSAVPVGALADPVEALGRRPVGPVRAGEALTDVRLVGPEAAAAAVGTTGAAGVPVRLADPAVAGLLRPGTRVDVVGGDPAGAGGTGPAVTGTGVGAGTGARTGVGTDVAGTGADGSAGPAPGDPAEGSGVLAAGAVVLDVLPAAERGGSGPVVLLALPGPVAARVAAATLGREVTVTLR